MVAATNKGQQPALAFAAAPPLKAAEFDRIRKLAYERFGLDLRSGKEELVAARLSKLLRRGGFSSYTAYLDRILAEPDGSAVAEMIDALTTNHTSFLRESAHFDFLVTAVQGEFRAQSKLSIWSAACATGEEPYSIAFCLLAAGLRPGSFRILATDISTRALEASRRAVYTADRFDHVPAAWKQRFLLKDVPGRFRISPEVAQTVEFRRLNLIEPFPFRDAFHFIFCRNVMIYFDRTTQTALVNKLAGHLEPGGYLFVGHSESLSGVQHPLAYRCPAVYSNSGAKSAKGGGR